MPSTMPGFNTVYPRGAAASIGTMPPGYVMVCRWMSIAEVSLWMANGGTFIPPTIGRTAGVVAVSYLGENKPAGIGRDSVIRIDFGVPGAALDDAGEGKQIHQPVSTVPIYNVSIHIP